MASDLKPLILEIQADIKDLKKGLSGAGKETESFAKKVSRDAKRAGLALAGIGIAAVKMASDFEGAFGLVDTLIPGQIKRQKELRAEVLRMSKDFGKSNKDVTAGLFNVISALGDTEDTMNILETTTRTAVAGNASLESSFSLLSAVTKAYNDTSAEAFQQTSDLAFKALELGQTTLPEMANSISDLTTASATLGVEQKELFALYASGTGALGNASQATTKFKGAIEAFIRPTKDMSAAFVELGFASSEQIIQSEGLVGAMQKVITTTDGTSQSIGKLFSSSEGLQAAMALSGPLAEDYANKLEKLENAAGATDKAFGEMSKNIDTRWKRLITAAKNGAVVWGTAISEALLPALESLAEKVGLLESDVAKSNRMFKESELAIAAQTSELNRALSIYGDYAGVADRTSGQQKLLNDAVATLSSALPDHSKKIKDLTADYGNLKDAVADLLQQKVQETFFNQQAEQIALASEVIIDAVSEFNQSIEKRPGERELIIGAEDINKLIENATQGEEAFREALQGITESRKGFMSEMGLTAQSSLFELGAKTGTKADTSPQIRAIDDLGKAITKNMGVIKNAATATEKYETITKALGKAFEKTSEKASKTSGGTGAGGGAGGMAKPIKEVTTALDEAEAKLEQTLAKYKKLSGQIGEEKAFENMRQEIIGIGNELFSMGESGGEAFQNLFLSALDMVPALSEAEEGVKDLRRELDVFKESVADLDGGAGAFGLGGDEVAAEYIEKLKAKFREESDGLSEIFAQSFADGIDDAFDGGAGIQDAMVNGFAEGLKAAINSSQFISALKALNTKISDEMAASVAGAITNAVDAAKAGKKGRSIGGIIGAIGGGIVGSLIPGVGTAAGISFGAGIGGAIGGSFDKGGRTDGTGGGTTEAEKDIDRVGDSLSNLQDQISKFRIIDADEQEKLLRNVHVSFAAMADEGLDADEIGQELGPALQDIIDNLKPGEKLIPEMQEFVELAQAAGFEFNGIQASINQIDFDEVAERASDLGRKLANNILETFNVEDAINEKMSEGFEKFGKDETGELRKFAEAIISDDQITAKEVGSIREKSREEQRFIVQMINLRNKKKDIRKEDAEGLVQLDESLTLLDRQNEGILSLADAQAAVTDQISGSVDAMEELEKVIGRIIGKGQYLGAIRADGLSADVTGGMMKSLNSSAIKRATLPENIDQGGQTVLKSEITNVVTIDKDVISKTVEPIITQLTSGGLTDFRRDTTRRKGGRR